MRFAIMASGGAAPGPVCRYSGGDEFRLGEMPMHIRAARFRFDEADRFT
jgi:hypothetical protein